MPILDEKIHQVWLKEAARGNPPAIEQVARLQYNLDLTWYHMELLNLLIGLGRWDGVKKVFCELTRGGGKSYILNFMRLYAAEYILPFLGKLPGDKKVQRANRRMIIYGRDERHLMDEVIQGLLEMMYEYSPWLKALDWEKYGQEGEKTIEEAALKGGRKWKGTRLDLTNGISIRGLTIRQSIRGAHVYWVDKDDILSEENANESEEFYKNDFGKIEPAIEPGGIHLVEGTPQQPGDYYSMLEDDRSWVGFVRPALDLDGKLGYKAMNEQAVKDGLLPMSCIKKPEDWQCLWPLRLSWDTVMSRKGFTRASDVKWRREYLLERIFESNRLVNPQDLVAALDRTLCYHRSVESEVPTYGGFDPSSLKRDHAAYMLGTLDDQGNRVLLWHEQLFAKKGESEEVKKRAALEVLERLNSINTRFHGPFWIIEGNGFQSVIGPLARGVTTDFRYDTFFLGKNKHTEAGWMAIRSVFEAGKIRMPYGPTPQELELFRQGRMVEAEFEAVRLTNELVRQLEGLQVVSGKILEDPKIKNDLVSALFLFIKATEAIEIESGIATMALGQARKELGVSQTTEDSSHPELTRQPMERGAARLAYAEQLRQMRRTRPM